MKTSINIANDIVFITNTKHDDSGWIIECHPDNIFKLFEIPLYGGQPQYQTTKNSLLDAINTVESYT